MIFRSTSDVYLISIIFDDKQLFKNPYSFLTIAAI